MRRTWTAVVGATALVVLACTGGDGRPAATPNAPPSGPATSSPTTTLAAGAALPEGCDHGAPVPRQVVSFVAEGRAWAVDPNGKRLTCLFHVTDAGPFTWGPQGDRVLMGGLEVRGVEPQAPRLLGTEGTTPPVFGWGHPMGLAVVFASAGDRRPQKRFMDDGHVEALDALPPGRYLDVAYHPSGLALAFVLERGGEQSIWLSTNEGLDPTRLVFSKGGTQFTSIAFTPDGEQLVWTAQHAGGFAQIHAMALDDRTAFTDGWRVPGRPTSNLQLAPRGGSIALDVGTGCDDRAAMIVLSPRMARLALPDASQPTTAIGWLDRSTLLVGVGGCGEPIDLVTVDADGHQTPVVLGAEIGATRTRTTSAPDTVPAPPVEAELEPPPGGVG